MAYTDLGPSGSYNGAVFWPVSGSGTSTYQSWADQFTASVGGALSQNQDALVWVREVIAHRLQSNASRQEEQALEQPVF